MYKEYEIGNTVRLKESYKGWDVGEVTGFYPGLIEVTLTNGKQVYVREDEIEGY